MNQTIEVLAFPGSVNGTASSAPKPRIFTVKEYDCLIETGFFNEDDKLELLNGIIIEKTPKGTKHALFNDFVAVRLMRALGDKVYVRNQNPIWLDENSESEPDIVLAEPPLESYLDKHPTPNEIYLILEVSDSTLNFDRNTKAAAYARAGIRQYLVLNVAERALEDYREPAADGFQFKQTLRAGQTFNLVAFPEVSLAITDFLPVEKE